ncbi:hypothetical protein AMAG_13434 [Allomyces macrogynus ATCC 38327]|uniref:Response regulatory domain-containing protein n=1 Tax=Allomyces macrogynus (strain ATCC 38327) TaxID=578462 RepID=A0A0L0T1S2_ALLM3|nr:hypothetical protein AMAG_13434 [Allomyces macrogynus ATCC 38327]|eukprot:KNE68793.1 hypothetical protein AMAG_13434 [Allomyces macrogynus ATCC 38327]
MRFKALLARVPGASISGLAKGDRALASGTVGPTSHSSNVPATSSPLAGNGDGTGFPVESRRRSVEDPNAAAAAAGSDMMSIQDKLLATLSHEVRTALTNIVGCADMLTTADLLPELRDAVGTIVVSSQHLLRVVDDVRLLSNLDGANVEITVQAMSITDVLAIMVTRVRPIAQDKNVSVQVDDRIQHKWYDGDLRATAHIVGSLVELMIRNTPDRAGVHVEARATPLDATRKRLSFRVAHVFLDSRAEAAARTTQGMLELGTALPHTLSTKKELLSTDRVLMCVAKRLAHLVAGVILPFSEDDPHAIQFEVVAARTGPPEIHVRQNSNELDTYAPNAGGDNRSIAGSASSASPAPSPVMPNHHLSPVRGKDPATAAAAAAAAAATAAAATEIPSPVLSTTPKSSPPPLPSTAAPTGPSSSRRTSSARSPPEAVAAVAAIEPMTPVAETATAEPAVPLEPVRPAELWVCPPDHVLVPPKTPAERAILVVEDDTINQRIIRALLRKLGYTAVIFASDGADALFHYHNLRDQSRYFDVILLDQSLPTLSGDDTAQRIRKLDRTQVIISCSANTQLVLDADLCRALGYDDAVAKPLYLDALRDVLQRWMVAGDARRVRHTKRRLKREALTAGLLVTPFSFAAAGGGGVEGQVPIETVVPIPPTPAMPREGAGSRVAEQTAAGS